MATTTDHLRNRVHLGASLAADSFHSQTAAATKAAGVAAAGEPAICLDPPGKIRSNLYIGSKESEGSLAALQAAGITHILQAGGELVPSFPDR